MTGGLDNSTRFTYPIFSWRENQVERKHENIFIRLFGEVKGEQTMILISKF